LRAEKGFNLKNDYFSEEIDIFHNQTSNVSPFKFASSEKFGDFFGLFLITFEEYNIRLEPKIKPCQVTITEGYLKD